MEDPQGVRKANGFIRKEKYKATCPESKRFSLVSPSVDATRICWSISEKIFESLLYIKCKLNYFLNFWIESLIPYFSFLTFFNFYFVINLKYLQISLSIFFDWLFLIIELHKIILEEAEFWWSSFYNFIFRITKTLIMLNSLLKFSSLCYCLFLERN